MVVAVVQQHVEARAEEEFAPRGGVAKKRGGEAEEHGVFVARDAEVRMEQTRGGVQVEASAAGGAVEAPRGEEATGAGLDEAAGRDPQLDAAIKAISKELATPAPKFVPKYPR